MLTFSGIHLALLLASTSPAKAAIISRPVQQSYVGDSVMSLLPALGLGPEVVGRSALRVVVKALSENGKGLVALRLHGEDVGAPQALTSNTRSFSFEVPASDGLIGDDLESLQLHLRGMVTVDSVGVELSDQEQAPPQPSPEPAPAPPPAPAPDPQPDPRDPENPLPPPPRVLPRPHPEQPEPEPQPEPQPRAPLRPGSVEKVEVRQRKMPGQSAWFKQFVDLTPYHGRRLLAIRVQGMSRYGTGRGSFCSGQTCQAFALPSRLSTTMIRTDGQTISRAAERWYFEFRGEFWIESIDLIFARECPPNCDPSRKGALQGAPFFM